MRTDQLLSDKALADLKRYDREFEAWRERNGGGTFSAFSAQGIKASLERGRAHTTLGNNLSTSGDWWSDGLQPTSTIYDKVSIARNDKVCDYGCGSLRIGVHVMQRQAPGCYYGIDVVDYFLESGKEIVGPKFLSERRPVLGTIAEKLVEVIDAGIHVLFAFNVAPHVHPDEQETFNENLKRICHRHGSRLLLHTVNAPQPVRYQRSGWAYPIEQYISWMRPLSLVSVSLVQPSFSRNGVGLRSYLLAFERDE